MALQKQLIPLSFTGKLDQKTDSKQLEVGNFTQLNNVRRDKAKAFKKRFGYTTLGQSSEGLAVLNDQLLSIGSGGVSVYSEHTGAFTDSMGYIKPVMADYKDILRDTLSVTQIDSATNNGVTLFAYYKPLTPASGSAGLHFTLYDEVAETVLRHDVFVGSTAYANPRCLALGNYIYFFFTDTSATAIYCYYLDVSAGSTTLNLHGLSITDLNAAAPKYDVCAIAADEMCIIYNASAAGTTNLKNFTHGNASTATASMAYAGTDSVAVCHTTSKIFAFIANTTNDIRCTIYTEELAVSVASFAVDATLADSAISITAIEEEADGSTPDQVLVAYEVNNSTTPFIRHRRIASDGTVTSLSSVNNLRLASKLFAVDGSTYITVLFDSDIQPTYFVMRHTGDGGFSCVAKLRAGLAGSNITNGNLYYVSPFTTATRVNMGVLTKTRLVTDYATGFYTESSTGNVFSLEGVGQIALDFDADDKVNYIQIENNVVFAGAIVKEWDGANIFESGFNMFPESITATVSSGSGNLDKSKVYYLKAVFEWTDKNGNIIRSAPSRAFSVTNGGDINTGGTSGAFNLTNIAIGHLPITQKDNVSLVLYSTQGNGDIYYRVSSVSAPTYTGSTQTHNVADSTLASREILYTTGGVLENIGPPACRSVALFNNRVVLLNVEGSATDAWFSKPKTKAEGLSFTDLFTFNVPAEFGAIKDGMQLDDKFVLFKESTAYYTWGEGPNNLGQGSFPIAARLNIDVGVSETSSLVNVPDLGILFKSKKGIYLLDRSLSAKYIGAPVEDYNSATIRSATLVPKHEEVRFLTSDSVRLNYNYAFNEWYTDDVTGNHHRGTDSLVWQDSYIFLNNDGYILKESDSAYSYDINTTWPVTTIETGWISLAGLQGFQRIYKVSLLGENITRHSVALAVGYDFNTSYVASQDAYSFDTNNLTDSGSTDPHSITFRLTRQKCQAVRFKITLTPLDFVDDNQDMIGGDYSYSGISLLVGLKPGTNRLRQGLKIGSTSGRT